MDGRSARGVARAAAAENASLPTYRFLVHKRTCSIIAQGLTTNQSGRVGQRSLARVPSLVGRRRSPHCKSLWSGLGGYPPDPEPRRKISTQTDGKLAVVATDGHRTHFVNSTYNHIHILYSSGVIIRCFCCCCCTHTSRTRGASLAATSSVVAISTASCRAWMDIDIVLSLSSCDYLWNCADKNAFIVWFVQKIDESVILKWIRSCAALVNNWIETVNLWCISED